LILNQDQRFQITIIKHLDNVMKHMNYQEVMEVLNSMITNMKMIWLLTLVESLSKVICRILKENKDKKEQVTIFYSTHHKEERLTLSLMNAKIRENLRINISWTTILFLIAVSQIQFRIKETPIFQWHTCSNNTRGTTVTIMGIVSQAFLTIW